MTAATQTVGRRHHVIPNDKHAAAATFLNPGIGEWPTRLLKLPSCSLHHPMHDRSSRLHRAQFENVSSSAPCLAFSGTKGVSGAGRFKPRRSKLRAKSASTEVCSKTMRAQDPFNNASNNNNNNSNNSNSNTNSQHNHNNSTNNTNSNNNNNINIIKKGIPSTAVTCTSKTDSECLRSWPFSRTTSAALRSCAMKTADTCLPF